MSDVTQRLEDNRSAIEEVLTAAEAVVGQWEKPVAPGKWSPSQLVEHLAESYEQGANVVAGRPSQLPSMPAFLRPVVRVLFFNRVVRKSWFPKSKTSSAMDPESGPESPEAGRARLEAAFEVFREACGSAGNEITSTAFGRVRLDDYCRFMEVHTRHHLKQMPQA
jgi:DinB family protein